MNNTHTHARKQRMEEKGRAMEGVRVECKKMQYIRKDEGKWTNLHHGARGVHRKRTEEHIKDAAPNAPEAKILFLPRKSENERAPGLVTDTTP